MYRGRKIPSPNIQPQRSSRPQPSGQGFWGRAEEFDPIAVRVAEEELDRAVGAALGPFELSKSPTLEPGFGGKRVVGAQSKMVFASVSGLQRFVQNQVQLLCAERKPGAGKIKSRASDFRKSKHVAIEFSRSMEV